MARTDLILGIAATLWCLLPCRPAHLPYPFISCFVHTFVRIQVRAILSGGSVHETLSFRQILVRFSALLAAMSGGLLVGPEGPFVLISAASAHLLSRLPPFRSVAANSYVRVRARDDWWL